MQPKLFLIVLVLGFTVLFGLFSSIGLANDFQKRAKFYNHCIVKEISKCQSKEIMLTSSSDNLRGYALLQKQKAEFYANEKDMLVQEMMKKNLKLKSYQIQYYLNKRYNELK